MTSFHEICLPHKIDSYLVFVVFGQLRNKQKVIGYLWVSFTSDFVACEYLRIEMR